MNDIDETPLLIACCTAQEASVKLLLHLKADPNMVNIDGYTSLHSAISADCSKEALQEIISHGANVNAVNKRGRTALLLGCSFRYIDSVRVLLEAGADASIADEEGFSCLHAAVEVSHVFMQLLMDDAAQTFFRHLLTMVLHIDATRKDGTNAFLRACCTGQSESVKFLVEAGADVSITKPDGNSSLHLAVKGRCSKESLQKIIDQGMINVNARNKKDETTLILACESAQEESVNLLLRMGSNPNNCNVRGYTSLHAAVHGNCGSNILQKIITDNVLLDAQDIFDKTALWLACSYRQQDSVNILLEAGSNPNTADGNSNTCLHAAVLGSCNKKIIRKITDHGANVNVTNKRNETALMIACVKKNEGAIKVLLNAGADPNIADDPYGDTSLHNAVKGVCSKDVLQAIIDHGTDVNATNKQNRTALMEACVKKNEGAINVLLNAHANPNIVGEADGDTCLHYAIKGPGVCSNEVLQALINHGVDLNATNKQNCTALMIACVKKNEGAINVLLNAHAEPNIVDEAYGDTCLHKASRGPGVCSNEVLQALINHGVDLNATNKDNRTALMVACIMKNEGAINVLLNAHADPNIVGEADGDTCLHYAIKCPGICSNEVLQAIIDHGVDVNATNKDNRTALMIACSRKNEGAINVLLNAHADPNIVGEADGDTCLHYAIKGPGVCSNEVLQALINHGVDLNATNKQNCTALMIACVKKNEGAINVLLNAHADPNIVDEADGDTCLHCVIKGPGVCSNEVLQAIINHGVDLNATNKDNRTALI